MKISSTTKTATATHARFNIFEGARRIAMFIAVIFTIGVIGKITLGPVDDWLGAVFMLIVTLFIFWVLVCVIGWVVRGFCCIPRGEDHRTK